MVHRIFWGWLTVLLLLATAPAYAEEWVLVGNGEDNAHYLDQASVEKKDNTVVYWAKAEYNEAQELEDGTFTRLHVKHRLDCPAKTVVIEQMQFYDAQNQLIADWTAEDFGGSANPIEEGTFIELEYQKLCQ